VTDQEKASWWKSLPGVLTAATGFVAALSGLVAGLNQLGVFRREPPAPSAVSTSPARPDTVPQPLARADTADVATPTPRATSPRPVAPAGATRPSAPAPTPAPTTRTSSAGDTAVSAQQSRLPTGTALELTVAKRTCAPRDGKQRFTARLAEPVKVPGATGLRSNTTAVLHLRRGDSADGPLVRLDSLVAQDVAASVPAASVRVRSGTDGAACIRANARIRATLGGPITLRRR
jgi:hypothetical protein